MDVLCFVPSFPIHSEWHECWMVFGAVYDHVVASFVVHPVDHESCMQFWVEYGIGHWDEYWWRKDGLPFFPSFLVRWENHESRM